MAQSVTADSAVKRTAMPAPAAAVITAAPRANIDARDVTVDIANVLGRRAVGRLLEKKLKKRAPDVPTITITDTTTSDWKTSTITTTAATTTFYNTSKSCVLKFFRIISMFTNKIRSPSHHNYIYHCVRLPLHPETSKI